MIVTNDQFAARIPLDMVLVAEVIHVVLLGPARIDIFLCPLVRVLIEALRHLSLLDPVALLQPV